MVLRNEPIPRQLVKTQRLPQLLESSHQANVGFAVVFRQAAPFLVDRALQKPLSGRLIRKGYLLAGLRDPEPCARPPELRQPVRVEVRGASKEQVVAQDVKRGARQQPGPFVGCARGCMSSTNFNVHNRNTLCANKIGLECVGSRLPTLPREELMRVVSGPSSRQQLVGFGYCTFSSRNLVIATQAESRALVCWKRLLRDEVGRAEDGEAARAARPPAESGRRDISVRRAACPRWGGIGPRARPWRHPAGGTRDGASSPRAGCPISSRATFQREGAASLERLCVHENGFTGSSVPNVLCGARRFGNGSFPGNLPGLDCWTARTGPLPARSKAATGGEGVVVPVPPRAASAREPPLVDSTPRAAV
ncbi:hypothetical protein THAOC_32360 [Thalassiosira oceanica]|uniref:Uncharacterized protein n=1 Tax=Thalassiosira oceanica TaxID=159749 RepID=K0R668_THAOC|nr:hypothetical protein THAOC_32360 [Thalassiosira oceanica]|eukprot:EJK48813.1 hypothetical protein THAOC_32360 [Thalassiosira oceanica]